MKPTPFTSPVVNPVTNPVANGLSLSPTQATALQSLLTVRRAASVIALVAPEGCGISTVLEALAAETGGCVFSAKDMVAAVTDQPANAFEEVIGRRLQEALERFPLVAIDDTAGYLEPGYSASTRPGFVRTVMRALHRQAADTGRTLVVTGKPIESWETPQSRFGNRCAMVTMKAFTSADYQHIAQAVAGTRDLGQVDFGVLFRFASHLNAHQLRLAFNLLSEQQRITTDDVIDCLARHVTSSNTRLTEVEDVSFSQLPGHEEIIETLMTNIVLPMANSDIAVRMGLRPKRGVLLFGPPGTGKTSIGRALAHQIRGKFFLIDGNFVTEPAPIFFAKVQAVIQEAKDNSPSVLFIDDADVLFRIEGIAGLSRFLLTLLDGLESNTANQVCVMMTAMDVRPIPEALLRSGRVELWLETKVPGAEVRARIAKRWLSADLPAAEAVDFDRVAAMTEGFTPADLRRVMGDAKTLFGADLIRGHRQRDASHYVQQAVKTMVAVRNRMADGLGDERLRLRGDATTLREPARSAA